LCPRGVGRACGACDVESWVARAGRVDTVGAEVRGSGAREGGMWMSDCVGAGESCLTGSGGFCV